MSCGVRSPAQIEKTTGAARVALTVLPLPNVLSAGALYGVGGCTVSVGTFLVNCCLQTGQGLVITYVITLFSLRARAACPSTVVTVHVECQKSCLFWTVLPKTRRSQTSPPLVGTRKGSLRLGPH